MKTLEANGFLDHNGILKLDNPLEIANQRVKVILLIPENEEVEIEDAAWLNAIKKKDAFRFLKDEAEDIYSLTDGQPIDDET